MLFLNLSAGYSLTKPDILYGYDFDGIYSTTLTTRTGELSHTVSAGIELSKGFYWKDLTAKLELGASWTDSPFLLQEQVARMSMQGYSAGLDISLSPFKFLGLTYNGSPHPAADRLQRPHPQLPPSRRHRPLPDRGALPQQCILRGQ